MMFSHPGKYLSGCALSFVANAQLQDSDMTHTLATSLLQVLHRGFASV